MHRLIRTLAFATLLPLAAAAQQFPNKVVRLMVPFPPGGATDIIGRLVSAKMQDVWGQPVVVENKPGAGTVVGTDYVAKSAPDGYTLGMVVTAYVINPSLRADLPYDTLKDLTGVTQVSVQHLVMAANPSLPANSIPELIALAKKEPGKHAARARRPRQPGHLARREVLRPHQAHEAAGHGACGVHARAVRRVDPRGD